jgi:site-specific recombinase XerD
MEPTHLTLEKALEDYQAVYLPAHNLAEKTRRFYRDDLVQLINFLADRGISHVHQLDLRSLNAFLADLDHQELSGYTRRRKASSIRSFLAYVESEGLLTGNLGKKLVMPKRESTQPRVLSEQEYKRLQLAVANQPRDAAIIALFLQTGMQLSELANLLVSDIELPTKLSKETVGHVFIRKGKGRKDRVVSLNYTGCKAVKAWLRVRPLDVPTQHLFFSKFKRPITHRGIEWLVNKYLDEAGIQRAHVHSLRHTFGTHAVKNGMNLRVVKEMMGHATLLSTDVYVSLAREQMDAEVNKFGL